MCCYMFALSLLYSRTQIGVRMYSHMTASVNRKVLSSREEEGVWCRRSGADTRIWSGNYVATID